MDACVDSGEFFRELRQHALREGVPVAVAIAPTYRCNFDCVHCFSRSSADPASELSRDTWLRLLDEMAECGCLFLLITGGEPLLRPDFGDLYRHARERGMIVTVFTNASLLNESHIRLFKEYPPRLVEVSVYGLSGPVHREVTGVAGEAEGCREAILALHRAGVRLALKTVPMKANQGEFEDIRGWAHSLGVPFRYDSCIMPRLDGGREPVAQRLPVAEGVDLEFSDPRRLRQWQEVHRRGPMAGGGGPLYRCSAGRTLAFVGPDGALHPCVAATHRAYRAAGVSFTESWREMHREMASLKTREDSACARCDKFLYCAPCVAFRHLDAGGEELACEYLCQWGETRRRQLVRIEGRGDEHDSGK